MIPKAVTFLVKSTMTELSFCVVLIIERYIPDAVLSGRSWPSFYLVINKVKSGSIKTPLENVRNQASVNLAHSFKVERLNNVRGLFRFKRIFFTLSPASHALTGFLKLSENLSRLETLKPPFYAFFELFKFSSVK